MPSPSAQRRTVRYDTGPHSLFRPRPRRTPSAARGGIVARGLPAMRAILSRWRDSWNRALEADADYLDAIPDRWVPAAIVAASALGLYAELVLVRWHATCFHAFAIFKNVSLLSCFLGLGIGFGLSGRRRIALAGFLPLLALQTLLFGVLSCTNLGGRIVNPVGEQLIMGSAGAGWSWLHA